MKVIEILNIIKEQKEWEFFQLGGLSYRTSQVIEAKFNEKFFKMNAEFDEYKAQQPWEDDEMFIQVEKGKYTMTGISAGMMVGDPRPNGTVRI